MSGTCNFTMRPNEHLSSVACFHPYAGGINADDGMVNDTDNLCFGGVVNDRGFRNKAASYDEVKLDSMKVSIIPARFASGDNTLTMCSMWDRKANPKECGWPGLDGWMGSGQVPTSLEIFNNEGTIKTTVNANSTRNVFRYVRATSIMEKSGYTDSTICYNETPDESPLNSLYLDAWLRAGMSFSPGLYFCMYSSWISDTQQAYHFSYKVEYCVTFRNPKSDMATFLTVEAPGYENPDNRALSDLQKTIHMIYETKHKMSQAYYDLAKSHFLPSSEREKSEVDEVEEKGESDEMVDDSAAVASAAAESPVDG